MKVNDVKGKVEKIIKNTEHPEINKTLFELGMISNITVSENEVSFTLKVPFSGVPIKDMLIDSIRNSLKDEIGDIPVKVNVEEMDSSERERFMKTAQEAWRG